MRIAHLSIAIIAAALCMTEVGHAELSRPTATKRPFVVPNPTVKPTPSVRHGGTSQPSVAIRGTLGGAAKKITGISGGSSLRAKH